MFSPLRLWLRTPRKNHKAHSKAHLELRPKFEEMEGRASPASIYWDGTGSNWGNTANWSTVVNAAVPDPGAVPGAADVATFSINTINSGQTVQLNADRSVSGLAFLGTNKNPTTLVGGDANRTLTLGTGGITVDSGAGSVTVGSPIGGQNVNITLGGSQAWTNNSVYSLTVQNAITNNTTNLALTVGGTGDTVINGNISAPSTVTGTQIVKTGVGGLTLKGTSVLNTVVTDTGTNSFISVNGGGRVDVKGSVTAYSPVASNRGTGATTVGSSSAGNTLEVSAGGKYLAGGLTIGGSSFGNNRVVVSTPGSSNTGEESYIIAGNGAALNIGASSSNNSFTISNGAYVRQIQGGGTNTNVIGTNAGANNNSLIITGTGSTYNRGGAAGSALNVGSAGSSNSVVLSDGGTLAPRRMGIGMNGGSNNFVSVSGPNSLLSGNDSQPSFAIGSDRAISTAATVAGSGNYLLVENRGDAIYDSNQARGYNIGAVNGANNNYVLVSGNDSTFTMRQAQPLAIGGAAGANNNNSTIADSTASGNYLSVINDASTFQNAVYVMGVNSAFNVGNGVGISEADIRNSATVNAAFTHGINLFNNTATLNINSGRIIAGSAVTSLITGPGTVNLNGPAYFFTNQSNSPISSAIAGSGTFIKEGTGTLTVSGANSYTGGTTVTAGTLQLNYATSNTSKLSDTAALTLAGGTLNLTGGSHNEVVGSTVIGSGFSNVTSSGPVLNANSITRNLGGFVNFGTVGIATTDTNNTNGIIGPWATVGGTDWATSVASGASDTLITPYTGYTDINNGGTIVNAAGSNVRIQTAVAGDTTLSNTTTTVNTILNSSTQPVTIATAGQTLQTSGILNTTGSGQLTVGTNAGDGSLSAATAGGDLTLANFSGSPLSVNASIVNNTTPSSLSVSGTGVVQLNTANTYSGGTYVGAGTLVVNDASGLPANSNLTVDGSTAVVNLAASPTLNQVVLANGGSITGSNLTAASDYDVRSGSISSGLDGDVGLNKTTEGIVTLTGFNNYTGATTVTAGNLVAGANNVLPNSSILTVNGATAVYDTGTFFDGVAGVVLDGNGNIKGTGTLNSIASNYDLRSGWVNAVLTGGFGLNKTTEGTVILTGANSYNGPTVVTAGTLVDQGPLLSGGIHDSSALRVDGPTAVFRLAVSDTVASVRLENGGTISGTGSVLSTGSGNFDLRDGSVTAVLGGNFGLDKTTSGTVTLSGSNTYTGVTTLDGGTLIVKAPDALGAGILSGVSGTLEIASASSITGGLNLTSASFSGGTTKFDLRGNLPGQATNGYDRIVATGAVNLDNATLQVTLGAYTVDTSVYTIISTSGGGSISGTFAGLPNGATVTTDSGQTFIINYTSTAVTLTVPPPTITGMAPTNGPESGGTSVVITGSGFWGATSVLFGGAAGSFVVNSASQITVTSPAGTGTVDVSVSTPQGGTSANTAADDFTYGAAAGPSITSIAPTFGTVTGGTSVIISGTGFTGATSVMFGASNAASFVVNSDTQITASTPAGSGVVNISVTTPSGTSANTAADDFAYVTKLTNVVIGDGTGQRSTIRKITLTFNGNIDVGGVGAGSISITNQSDVVIPGLNINVAGAGTNTLVLTFSDTNPNDSVNNFNPPNYGTPASTGPVTFGSLVDGLYRLKLNGATLLSGGVAVDIDANGTAGGTRNDDFHRLFGDKDGDQTVGTFDYFPSLINAINKELGEPGYDAAWDYDNDDVIGTFDFFPHLVNRFNAEIF